MTGSVVRPRVLVLRAPGTNCDVETAFAFEQAGAIADRVHVARLLENPHRLQDYQILCIPSGFSYGDDIAAGKNPGHAASSASGRGADGILFPGPFDSPASVMAFRSC